MTTAAASTNTPSVLMSPSELSALVNTDVDLSPQEKAICVQQWKAAMDVPLSSCASCGMRDAPRIDHAALERRDLAVDLWYADIIYDGAAGGEAWAHLEVDADSLRDEHPKTLLGTDVCLMKSAYPEETLVLEGSVGWRAEVRKQRKAPIARNQVQHQVQLFGHWFDLYGPHVRPLRQLRDSAPRSSVQEVVAPMQEYTWHQLSELEVLRMADDEWCAWKDARARLDNMPLLGPSGQEAGRVNLSDVCSVYHPSNEEPPYYLHPELVDASGPTAICLLCPRCAADVEKGVCPKLNVKNADYGSLARIPQLEPLSYLEEMLLSPIRLYHIVVKVGAICSLSLRSRVASDICVCSQIRTSYGLHVPGFLKGDLIYFPHDGPTAAALAIEDRVAWIREMGGIQLVLACNRGPFVGET